MITVETCQEARRQIKAVAEYVAQQRQAGAHDPEALANVTLAYRHLEDASMRLGKAIQALDGGVSVYDPASTVGA